MAHNFIEGIDLIGDPTGNTALANTTFISVDGNSANAGNDPQLPKQLLDSASVPTPIIVIGSDQTYEELPTGNKTYIGDGMVILDGEGVRGIQKLSFGTGLTLRNLHITNFIHSVGLTTNGLTFNNTTNYIENCIFEGNVETQIRNQSISYAKGCTGNFVKDQDFDLTGAASGILNPWSRCIFYSGSLIKELTIDLSGSSDPSPERLFHSNVFINQRIITNTVQIELFENCYFENCEFIIDGTPYASIALLQAAIPTACPNAVLSGANFKGSLDNNEFRGVNANSTLLGAGKFGVNIGNVNEGLVFNQSNVQSSSNITFNSGSITLTNPLLDGQIVWEDSFSKVVTNPFLHLNGIPDFVNNLIKVVQSPDPINPRKSTVSIETKDKFTPYRPTKIYRTGYTIGEDLNGLSSGDDDYHQFSQPELRVIGVRLTMTVKA